MFGGLRLNKGQETFVLLRRAEELEGDPALAIERTIAATSSGGSCVPVEISR